MIFFTLCASKAFGGRVDGPDVFLEDDVLRRGRTDDLREPSEVGRAPIGPARVPYSMPEQKGFEPKSRGLEIAEGICTRPAEVSDGFIFHLGHRDRGAIPRAGQTGQLHGLPAVGFDAVTGLFGNQRRRYHPAVVVFFREIPLEPVAAGAGFIDKDQMFGL